MEEVVNAFLDGGAVVLLHRRPDGTVFGRRHRAEYVTYHRKHEVLGTGDFERALRAATALAGMREEGEWLRLSWRDRESRERVCSTGSPFRQHGIEVYEGDVDPIRRLLTDTPDAVIAKPRRCMLDIETDSRVPFSRKEHARILTWAVVGMADGRVSKGVLAADTDRAERALLDALWEALRAYDQVGAWYGDGFDFPVVFARSKEQSCAVDPRRWLWLDYLECFKKLNKAMAESGEEKQSFALQSIGMQVVGRGKVDFDSSKTWEAWEAGGERRAALLEYNVQDAVLLRDIDVKKGYGDLFQAVGEACRVFTNTAGLSPVREMDGFLLRLGLERGYHFPTRLYREQLPDQEQYEGAFVLKPEDGAGILRDIHVGDFKSLYPSVIISFNISPDTKVVGASRTGPVPPGCCRCPTTGVTFRVRDEAGKPVVGILPSALLEMLRLRAFWSARKAQLPPGTPESHDADCKSNAYKLAANSFYGVSGSPFSRYYDRDLAESTTLTGVWLIKHTIASAVSRGWNVVYSDTDAAYVHGCTTDEFRAFTRACNGELYPALLAACGCVENLVQFDYEKAFARIVMVTAKRYAAWYLHFKGNPPKADSKPEVKGLEYKRGDSARLARDLQAEVIDALIVEGDETIERYHEMIARVRAFVVDGELGREHVVLSKSLGKRLRDYVVKLKQDGTPAALPPHVQVAKVLEERGCDVREGTRIEYVVVDGDCSPMKVMPADDYTGGEADRCYIWESYVYPPTKRFLQAAFPTHDWESWQQVRPPKLRTRAAKAEAAGQLVFFDSRKPGADVVPTVPAQSRAAALIGPPPFVVRLPVACARRGMGPLRGIFDRYPGARPVRLVLVEDDATEVEIKVQAGVASTPAFAKELAEYMRSVGAA